MSTVIVALYKPGESWISGKPVSEQPLKLHLDYLLELHTQGHLLMGGPFTDSSGGLVVFSDNDLEAVKQMVAADPGITSRILAAEIVEWNRIV